MRWWRWIEGSNLVVFWGERWRLVEYISFSWSVFFLPTVFTNAGISSDLFAIVPVGMIFGINAMVLQMLEAVQICLKLFLLG